MADTDKSSKTEQPTTKRLDEARRKGNFAKAAEIGVTALMIAGSAALAFGGASMGAEVMTFSRDLLGSLNEFTPSQQNAAHTFGQVALLTGSVTAPVLLGCVFASILAGGLQSGFRLTPDVLKVNFNKFNPVNGFKRIFSSRSLMQFFVDLAKFGLVGAVIYGAILQAMADPIFYAPVGIDHIVWFLGHTSALLMIRLIAVLAIIAFIHYLFERRKTNGDLKMTKQEVRDERKNAEGDPKVRGEMRRRALRALQTQMLDEVPNADVVVTNPTHYAIALKYERGRDLAPVILAKGENLFAKRIKAIAAQHGVPTVENKPVARLLFRVGRVGEPVPYELYEVIAKILSHVYRTHRYYFHQLRQRRLAMAS
ncbi:MAG: flagellar biosynthesis protein FlhB [Opitutales bacterium]